MGITNVIELFVILCSNLTQGFESAQFIESLIWQVLVRHYWQHFSFWDECYN